MAVAVVLAKIPYYDILRCTLEHFLVFLLFLYFRILLRPETTKCGRCDQQRVFTHVMSTGNIVFPPKQKQTFA